MSDPEAVLPENKPDAVINAERYPVFVLAGLLLASLVSIAFFNLDRHPAFSRPNNDFMTAVKSIDGPVIYANDPVALAALSERQADLTAIARPLESWPPPGPLVSFGVTHDLTSQTKLELVADAGIWTLWIPVDYAALPYFGDAIVETLGPDGQAHRCPPKGDGYQCGEAGWTRVRREVLTIEGERNECIWAHPIADRTLRVTFSPVATSTEDGKRLWLRTALRDAAVGAGGDVDFTVYVGDRELRHRHRDRRGWQQSSLPATETPRKLVVEISAAQVGRRHICFDFEMR